MDNQHSASNASQKRKARAYAIVKRVAMASGYMRHERDVEGFEAWCDEFELLNGDHALIMPEHTEALAKLAEEMRPVPRPTEQRRTLMCSEEK